MLKTLIYIYLFLIYYVVAKPNVILLVVDDIGWSDTSINNPNNDIQTPYLKNLQESGVILYNHYTSPVCSPTRSSLMTGLFPFRMGMQHQETLMPGSNAHIPLEVQTLPEIMHDYDSHLIGKWHLGYSSTNYTPLGRGFNSHFGYYQGQIDYYNKTVYGGYDFWKNDEVFYQKNDTHSTFQFHYQIKNFLQSREKKEKPFFLYLSLQLIHVPITPSFNFCDNCNNIQEKLRYDYCCMIGDMEYLVETTIKSLNEHNLYDDTIVIFTTDNGGMVPFAKEEDGELIWPSSSGANFPLRGSKTNLFEGGVRATTFITGGINVFPHKSRNSTYNGITHAVDLASTILDISDHHKDNIDGHKLWDNLNQIHNITYRDRRNNVPINIIYLGKSYSAIRFGKYKLIMGSAVLWDGTDGYWSSDNCVIPPEHLEDHYLFNLEDDPYEQNELILRDHINIYLTGRNLIKNYVKDNYREPQINFPNPYSLPFIHNGTWKPYKD